MAVAEPTQPLPGCTSVSLRELGAELRKLPSKQGGLVWPCAEHVRHVPLLSLEKTLPDNATRAAIAQLGERQTEDLKVPGSIPGLGTFCEAR